MPSWQENIAVTAHQSWSGFALEILEMGAWGPNVFKEWDPVFKTGVLKQCWISFKIKENGVLGTNSFWKMWFCLENWDKKGKFLLQCKPSGVNVHYIPVILHTICAL